MEARRTYIAIIEPFAVRNTQICRTDATDTTATGTDKNWENVQKPIYLGVYVGDYGSVLNEVVDEFNIDPENIDLIDADSDSRIL